MAKLKILYTIPNFDTAGSGKVLYDLAKGLDKEHFEVSIACKHNKGVFFNEVATLGIPIHIIDTTVSLKPYYSLVFRLNPFKTFIKKHKFDIVHSWHWSSNWTEVLATRLSGAKFVYTKKAMTWGNVHWKIKSYLSNFIITVNEEMRNYFPSKKNQKLIPFGIDTNYYRPKPYPKNTSEHVFKIITVANLVPVKGIEVLIKAINLLINKDIHLDILGDDIGDYANKLKQLVIDLNLEKQVTFSGKHSDIRPFLSRADLYIIPSKKEGMPMALVEAMAMEIPVLGSDISGINFVLKEFPQFMFEVSNIKMLSDKIKMFYKRSEAERQQVGRQLRNYCIKHFSMDMFIIEHEKLYKAITK